MTDGSLKQVAVWKFVCRAANPVRVLPGLPRVRTRRGRPSCPRQAIGTWNRFLLFLLGVPSPRKTSGRPSKCPHRGRAERLGTMTTEEMKYPSRRFGLSPAIAKYFNAPLLKCSATLNRSKPGQANIAVFLVPKGQAELKSSAPCGNIQH